MITSADLARLRFFPRWCSFNTLMCVGASDNGRWIFPEATWNVRSSTECLSFSSFALSSPNLLGSAGTYVRISGSMDGFADYGWPC